MTDLLKAAQAVLEALKRYEVKRQDFDRFADEIDALRAALAEFTDWEAVAADQALTIALLRSKLEQEPVSLTIEEAVAAERDACARIVEQNAQSCANSPTLSDILNANALLIRERGNT